MERKEFTKEDLEKLKLGCIFICPVLDNEENHEWIFAYIKTKSGFMYLGGVWTMAAQESEKSRQRKKSTKI